MAGTLTRWDPFAELGELRTRFDRMLTSGWTAASAHGRRRSTSCARTAIWSSALTSRGSSPRRSRSRSRTTSSRSLVNTTESAEEKDENYVRRERRYGSFSRSMALPVGTNAKQIKAKTHDGVVEATIPLPKEATKETVTITPTAS